MTKEEKIKEAYISEFTNNEQDFNDRFEFLKPYIDEYGWLCGKLHDVDMSKFDVSGHEIRPKSLSGIENNNGWIKIESEEYLPKENINCWLIHNEEITKGAFYKNYFESQFGVYGWKTITHYMPIKKPHPPIY